MIRTAWLVMDKAKPLFASTNFERARDLCIKLNARNLSKGKRQCYHLMEIGYGE